MCIGFPSSRKRAAPAEANKKQGWGNFSLFPHLAIKESSPIRKWERGLKNQSLSLKRCNKHIKQEGIWERMMCFPPWLHPCSRGLIIHQDFLYIHRNKLFLCVRLRPKPRLPGTIRLCQWANKDFPALRPYSMTQTQVTLLGNDEFSCGQRQRECPYFWNISSSISTRLYYFSVLLTCIFFEKLNVKSFTDLKK